MKNKIKKPATVAGCVAFWVLVWHIAAGIANKNLLLKIPLPLDTAKTLILNFNKPLFWQAVLTSLSHVLLGFVSAVVLGTLAAIVANHSRLFNALSAPIFHIIRSVPVAAFIIIAWLWVPTYFLPPFISFLMVFPIIKSQIDSGLSAVDNRLTEMATVYGMGKFQIIKHIKIPTVLPFLRTASITGLGIGWKSGIAAEVICNPTGSLGALLSGAKSTINYEQVFAVTLMVVILSLILENILKLLWKEKNFGTN